MDSISIMTLALSMMFIFLIKHCVIDFFIQLPYMYLNKGKLFHPGGILHSAEHALVTFVGLYAMHLATLTLVLGIALFEFFVHYFIDYAKININAHFGWTPTTSENYWKITGLDQLLHGLTYIVITYYFLVNVLLSTTIG